MSDTMFAAYLAISAGYMLGRLRPIACWRQASERRVRFSDYGHLPQWRWALIVIEFAVTHPAQAWRVWRSEAL